MSFLLALSLLAFVPLSLSHKTNGGYLYPQFYDHSCPKAQQIVKSVMAKAVAREVRMAASIMRLHFHDCFVKVRVVWLPDWPINHTPYTMHHTPSCLLNIAIQSKGHCPCGLGVFFPLLTYFSIQGCDASILLDSSGGIISEKNSVPNRNSARGFEVIDDIKSAVEKECPHTVSCSDILAIAARDSSVLVSIIISCHIFQSCSWHGTATIFSQHGDIYFFLSVQTGGPSWEVPLGRRDSRGASLSGSNNNIPAPNNTFQTILTKFKLHGLNIVDLVALSGKIDESF